MENKTTTELLNLLGEITSKDDYDWEQVETIMDELKKREPFTTLLLDGLDDSLPGIDERLKIVEADIKKLKRHKHGDNGDVLVRI